MRLFSLLLQSKADTAMNEQERFNFKKIARLEFNAAQQNKAVLSLASNVVLPFSSRPS